MAKKTREETTDNTENKETTPAMNAEKKRNINAHNEAEKDIEEDPDLHTHPEKGDDLDEGELARLEGED